MTTLKFLNEYQKDIEIADLKRQLFEKLQNRPRFNSEQQSIQRGEQQFIEQETKLKALIDVQQSSLVMHNQVIKDLVQERDRLKLERTQAINELYVLKEQRQSKDANCNAVLRQIQEASTLAEENAELNEQAYQAVLLLAEEEDNELRIKQESMEDLEKKLERNDMMKQQVEELLMAHESLLRRRDEVLAETRSIERSTEKVNADIESVQSQIMDTEALNQEWMKRIAETTCSVGELQQQTDVCLLKRENNESQMYEVQEIIRYQEQQFHYLDAYLMVQDQDIQEVERATHKVAIEIVDLGQQNTILKNQRYDKRRQIAALQEEISDLIERMIALRIDSHRFNTLLQKRELIGQAILQRQKRGSQFRGRQYEYL